MLFKVSVGAVTEALRSERGFRSTIGATASPYGKRNISRCHRYNGFSADLKNDIRVAPKDCKHTLIVSDLKLIESLSEGGFGLGIIEEKQKWSSFIALAW